MAQGLQLLGGSLPLGRGRIEQGRELIPDEPKLHARRLQLLRQGLELREPLLQLGPNPRRLGLRGALGLVVEPLQLLELLGGALLDVGDGGRVVPREPRAFGPRFVELEPGLLQLDRRGLELEDALLEAGEGGAGGLLVLRVSALPLGDLLVALGERGAEGAAVFGDLGPGLLELALELGDALAQPVTLLGDLAVDPRPAVGLGSGGGRRSGAGVAGLDEAAGGLVLFVDPGAELLHVGPLVRELRLQGGDALDVRLVGPLDALDVDVVLVQDVTADSRSASASRNLRSQSSCWTRCWVRLWRLARNHATNPPRIAPPRISDSVSRTLAPPAGTSPRTHAAVRVEQQLQVTKPIMMFEQGAERAPSSLSPRSYRSARRVSCLPWPTQAKSRFRSGARIAV